MGIWDKVRQNEDNIFDIVILLFVTAFLLFSFNINGIFNTNVPDGGDYLFHYSRAHTFFHEVPFDRIQFWSYANNAGYAFLMYYPPFIIVAIAYLAYLLPLPVVFKIVSLLGILFLPVIAFISIRRITKLHIAPPIAIVLLMLFLYQKDNFAYGGNINSAIVGEFCYSIALLFLLLYTAFVYTGIKTGKNSIAASILMFITCITHPVPWILSLFIPLWAIFKCRSKEMSIYLVKMYSVGLLLCACWFVPYVSKISYNNFAHSLRNVHEGLPYGWTLDTLKSIYPNLLFPVIIACGAICLLLFVHKKLINDEISYIGFILLLSAILFYFKPFGWAIRFLPFVYLYAIILVSLFIGLILENKSDNYILNLLFRNRKTILIYISIIVVIFISRSQVITSIHGTTTNMFNGVDGLRDSLDIKQAAEFLRNQSDDARVSSFDIKPEFIYILAGRQTMHGMFTYSYSNLFVNKIKSSIENGDFDKYSYFQLDLFNAPWVIPKENKSIVAIEESGYFDLIYNTSGKYPKKIYKLRNASMSYVSVLKQKPMLYTDIGVWKEFSMDWFKDRAAEPILAYSKTYGASERENFILSDYGDAESYANPPNYLEDCKASAKLMPGKIYIDTNCIGRALLIKVSYHPNWKVKGADKIYQAGPGMMMVFPQSNHLEFNFARTMSDILGTVLFLAGIFSLLYLYHRESQVDSFLKTLFGRFKIFPRVDSVCSFINRWYKLIFLIIVILLILIANIYLKLDQSLIAKYKFSKAMELMNHDNIPEAIKELNGISSSFEEMKQSKEFYLALLYLQQHDLPNGKSHLFKFVGKEGNTERTAMLRYYYITELGNNHRKADLLHEMEMIRTQHAQSEWRSKAEEYFKGWKSKYNYTESAYWTGGLN